MSETEIIKPLHPDVDPTIKFILEAFELRVESVSVVHSTEPLEVRTTIMLVDMREREGASHPEATHEPEAVS